MKLKWPKSLRTVQASDEFAAYLLAIGKEHAQYVNVKTHIRSLTC